MKVFTTALVATSLLLTACATQGGEGVSKETTGTVLGGLLGGFLGSQFGEGSGKTAVTIAGALLGAWAGNNIAKNMNQQDQVQYQKAATAAQTLPVGETVTWYTAETGNSGTITPTREGTSNKGEYCREYQQTIMIDGKTERAFGIACQEPNGDWRIVNTSG